MKVIDLFCGCGGASLGLMLDGHRVVGAVDNDPVACEVFEKNLGLKPLNRNLRYLKPHKILEHYGLQKDDIDLIVGCPPCQGFSSLRRTRYPKGKDKRKGLISVFLKQSEEIDHYSESCTGTLSLGLVYPKTYDRKRSLLHHLSLQSN